MYPNSLRRLVRSLCKAGQPPGVEPVADAELLQRFVSRRDEAAFELLLWRHGPMVLAVCRRLLRHADDAEDAFQATFLTFVRKAGSIGRGDAVGGWLHRVAYRGALRARAARARHERREQTGLEVTAAAREETSAQGIREVLDQELDRLPARQRTAFVLCCLEGKTGEEVARQLGCPPGTVSSRLTRARERLRRRLARRGLAPSAGALAAVLARPGSASPLPVGLVKSTLKGSLLFVSGKTAAGVLSGRAVSLAEGVVRAMFLTRLRIAALVVLVAGLLIAGGVLGRRHAVDAAPTDEARLVDPSPKPHDGPVVVRVTRPEQGGLERLTTVPCSAQAFEKVDLAAAASGRLKNQAVDIGDQVKKGQVLAEIDAPLLALDSKQAAAAVQQAQGAVREAQAHVATAQAGVEAGKSAVARAEAETAAAKAAVAFRQRQLDRYKDLLNSKSVEQRVVDEREDQLEAARGQLAAATAAVATARADVDVRKSKVVQAGAGLKTAEANLEAAHIALEKAEYMLSLTRIVSPVDGVITRRNYFVGDYLQPGGPGAAVPVLTVQRTDRVRVVTQVAESDVPRTHPGVPATVTFPALPGLRLPHLKVTRVGFVEDPDTRTMRVEIDVPNREHEIRPGMFGRATLDLGPGPREAVRVPQSALASTNTVYVVRDGKTRRTLVEVGARDGKEVEILSGLKPDDLVVTNPDGLKGDGRPVKVDEPAGK